MFVCVFVCLFVCVFVCLSSLYRLHRLTEEAEISTYIPIWKYLKMVSFTFLNFCFFSELSPFFIFHYFLYFETTSQPIMEINTPNWSLGLVEYIKYKGISLHSYDVMIWRHKFQMSKLSPILQFKHFECLLDDWCYMYNVSCC